jgi:hypothetical protein
MNCHTLSVTFGMGKVQNVIAGMGLLFVDNYEAIPIVRYQSEGTPNENCSVQLQSNVQ